MFSKKDISGFSRTRVQILKNKKAICGNIINIAHKAKHHIKGKITLKRENKDIFHIPKMFLLFCNEEKKENNYRFIIAIN